MNLRLVNKILFKYINDDIVIQRYYLKLKYNIIIKDGDLFKYIKLLDSKSYSRFIKQRNFDKNRPFFISKTNFEISDSSRVNTLLNPFGRYFARS